MKDKKQKKVKLDMKTYIHVKVDEPTTIGTYSIKNRVLSKIIEKAVDLDFYLKTGRNRKKFEAELAESRKMFQAIGKAVKQEAPINIEAELQEEFNKTMEELKKFNEEKADAVEVKAEPEPEVLNKVSEAEEK